MSGFNYQFPLFLWLLLLALPLAWWEWRRRNKLTLPVSSLENFSRSTPVSVRKKFEWIALAFWLLGVCALIVAAAGPQMSDVITESKSEGVDVLLVVDTSGSMRAEDMTLDGREAMRITAVKKVVAEFIAGRSNDRLGMVVFGTEAFTQCPLTTDHQTLQGYLDLIEVGMAGEDTAIGQAIALSVKRFLKSSAKSKVIILLTDGKSTSGAISPHAAAEAAKANGIKIYSIGVGSDNETVPIVVQTLFGPRRQRVKLEMDEQTLKEIAKMTGGAYFRANSTDTLREIYGKIDKLEKVEIQQKNYVLSESLARPFLFFALFAIATSQLLRLTWLRRLP